MGYEKRKERKEKQGTMGGGGEGGALTFCALNRENDDMREKKGRICEMMEKQIR